MRFAEAWLVALMLAGQTSAPAPFAPSAPPAALVPVHLQRYCMGTTIDIVAYHASRPEAERAVERAMQEIERLDRVLSHFKADSDLSRVNREAHNGFVEVDPSLYEAIDASLSFSRRSAGRFDVTIAPLLKVWQEAAASGRQPSDESLAAARRCVGYDAIELAPPNRIHLRSDCVAIDLGGIGKGYAVDRAIALLKADGIEHALVNAGGSSIAAMGAPPGAIGWPVRLGVRGADRDVLLLRDASMSTSQQRLVQLAFARGMVGDIINPRTGEPTMQPTKIVVVMPNGTAADALSTSLVMMSIEEARPLLDQFEDVSALWISPAGALQAAYHEPRLQFQAP